MAKKNIYKGFSSLNFELNKTFKIFDIDVVKIDILNHIFTKKGDRVMMPNFGTSIPDLVFEPIDDITLEKIREELNFVFNYDPRVELINLIITPLYDENSIEINALLKYIELDKVDNLNFNIEFRENF